MSRLTEGVLWDQKWERLIRADLKRYPQIDLECLAFLEDTKISPLTRYLVVMASHNFAMQVMAELSAEDENAIVTELRNNINSIHSGRLWMNGTIEKFHSIPRFDPALP